NLFQAWYAQRGHDVRSEPISQKHDDRYIHNGEKYMKTGIRIALTGTASASLLALTGCAGLFGPDLENPPLLSEIDDLMWQSMEEAGTIPMIADLEDFAKVKLESAYDMRQMIGDDLFDLRNYCVLDDSVTAISLDDNELMIVFGGDEAYMYGNAIF